MPDEKAQNKYKEYKEDRGDKTLLWIFVYVPTTVFFVAYVIFSYVTYGWAGIIDMGVIFIVLLYIIINGIKKKCDAKQK